MSKTTIFTADVQLYSTKISFGDRVGADWGKTPWPSLRTSPGWGNCAYVSRGIDTPGDFCTTY